MIFTKKNNNYWFIIIALVILVVAIAHNGGGDSLNLSTSHEDRAALVTGVNNYPAPTMLTTSSFTGTKNSVLKNNLFSFRDITPEMQCMYVSSAPNTYELTANAIDPIDHCYEGQYVQFVWGPNNPGQGEGSPMFAELWEKTVNTALFPDQPDAFHFNDYWVRNYAGQGYDYSYNCYWCVEPQDTRYCTDTDGGDEKFVAGKVHVTVDSPRVSYTIDSYYDDYCKGSAPLSDLVEYTCGPDGDVKSVRRACLYGCQDGRCLSASGTGSSSTTSYTCVENDNGKNLAQYSTTTLSQGASTVDQQSDYCTDANHLKEYYCNSPSASSISSDVVECVGGCVDGACSQTTNSGSSGTTTSGSSGTTPASSYDACSSVRCVGGNPTCIDSNNAIQEVYDTCSSSEDCEESGNTATCVDNNPATTTPECSSDNDCSSGQECNSGSCESIPYEAHVEKVCFTDGTTVVWKDSNDLYSDTVEDCAAEGLVCSAGECVASENESTPNCVTNADCFRPGSVMECVSGSCVNLPPTSNAPAPEPAPAEPTTNNRSLVVVLIVAGLVAAILLYRRLIPRKKKVVIQHKARSNRSKKRRVSRRKR